ncbi:MAG: CBS domain-containing protein [Pseudomonadota bacterium]
MRIADAMTRDVHVVHPGQSIVDAARMMADLDCGALPVAENDQLVGMITDRDIVIRALAQGKDADTRIEEVMSTELKYCFEEDELDNVARNMGDLQIRRLPVVSRDKRLVGIVSLGDIAITDEKPAAEALSEISAHGTSQAGSGQRPH